MAPQEWAGQVVAVTGACGGYGAFLVRSLVNAGAHVRALDIRKDDHLDFLEKAEAQGKAKFFALNLVQEDTAPLKAALAGVQAVFHTVAFFGDPPFSMRKWANPDDEEKTRRFNVELADRVMAVSRECGVKAFVYTSSLNSIFCGVREVVNVTEDVPYPDPSECLDMYSICKAETERLVLKADGKGGLRTASVRPNGIYGPTHRLVAVIKALQGIASMEGMYTKFIDKHGKEPVADWCHAENLALLQMLAAKQLLEGNPRVCGQTFAASDDVICTNSEFYAPILRGAGWAVMPVVPLPAGIMHAVAYTLEAVCYYARRATGCRSIIPPLTVLEVAKATMTNSQVIDKAKRELGYVPIPQAKLMEKMAEFAGKWAKKYSDIPAVPLTLWLTVPAGCAAVLFLSFADVRRMDGTPWLALRSGFSLALPAFAEMPLEVFQRKVFRIGLCLPMVGIHAVDAVVAAHMTRSRGHQRWFMYGFRTFILGAGQFRHLLSASALKAYGAICVAVFGLAAGAAARAR